MKKSTSFILLPVILMLAFIPFFIHAQGLMIKQGSHLVFSGSPHLEIQGGNFTNNGTYTRSGETIRFSGTGTPHKINGAQPTTFNNLIITNNTVVRIPPGIAASVAGTLTNNNGTSGLVIMSDASGTGSLINSTTGVNGTVQRYIAHRTDNIHGWHFLSSPVVSQAIQPEFVPEPPGSDQDFFYWDEEQALWINTKDDSGNWASGFETTFIQGKGYLVNYLNDVTKNFSGVLNVSDISKTGLTLSSTGYSGWNLLGNPFTSALIWNTGWTMSNIASIAKIWNESGASYSDILQGEIIPVDQGFMVQVTSGAGSMTIPATARTHSSQGWYKASDDPCIKLVANDLAGKTFQESVVTFIPQATEGYDTEFDSRFLQGYAPRFYSLECDEQLSTNTLPSLDNQTTIPFNFVKTDGNNYTIEAVQIDNVPAQVFLTDLKANQTQNLKENNVYPFTSIEGDDPARFLLSFSHVGIEPLSGETIHIYVYGNILCVSNPGESTVEVFNMIGQKLFAEKTRNEPLYKVKLQAVTGYYIIRVTTGQKVFAEKVFVK
jgi:hypothetical protein